MIPTFNLLLRTTPEFGGGTDGGDDSRRFRFLPLIGFIGGALSACFYGWRVVLILLIVFVTLRIMIACRLLLK